MTSLSYWDGDGNNYLISIKRGDLTGDEFAEELIKPLMLAIGYHPNTVKEVFGEDDEDSYLFNHDTQRMEVV